MPESMAQTKSVTSIDDIHCQQQNTPVGCMYTQHAEVQFITGKFLIVLKVLGTPVDA